MDSYSYGIRLLMSIVMFMFIFWSFISLKNNYNEFKHANKKIQKFILHILISVDMALIFYMILGLISIGIQVLDK